MKRMMAKFILTLGMAGATLGQTPAPTPKSNLCEPPEEICMGEECQRGDPIIFGKPYLVPKLKIRLLDENTNKPVRTSITLNYVWKWLEYPYTERPFGVWSEENYSTTCYSNEEGVIEVGEFKVEPHGWYKGIYSVGKKPTFLNVTAGYELPYVRNSEKKCYTYTEITRSRLDKCRRSGNCEFTIKDACSPDWN